MSPPHPTNTGQVLRHSLALLPAEILLQIFDYTNGWSDVLSLSLTCKILRNFLAPRLFASIRLENEKKSSKSVLRISRKHGENDKELRYIGNVRTSLQQKLHDSNGSDSKLKRYCHTAPLAVGIRKILSNLRIFPQLRYLNVSFGLDSYITKLDADNMPLHSLGKAVADEATQLWCDMMDRSLRALCKSNPAKLEALNFAHAEPVTLPAFKTAKWRKWLSNASTFSLCLQVHVLHQFAHQSDHLEFSESLSGIFFQHLRNTRTFELTSTRLCYPGPSGLGRVHLPMLKHFKLERFLLSREIVQFLSNHLKALESLDLVDCVRVPWEMSWGEIFDAICVEPHPGLTVCISYSSNFISDAKVWRFDHSSGNGFLTKDCASLPPVYDRYAHYSACWILDGVWLEREGLPQETADIEAWKRLEDYLNNTSEALPGGPPSATPAQV